MSTLQTLPDLSAGVTAIDEEIRARGVRRGVTCKVDISALQFLSLSITSQGDHALPQLLSLGIDEIGQTGVDVTGRDAVDTGKVPPLVGERLGQMDTAGLGNIVGCLLLREIGNVAGHGGSDDERAGFALTEVEADGSGAVVGTVEIGIDDLLPLLHGLLQNAIVGRLAGVGNHDVNLAELLDDLLHKPLDIGVVANVALVGLALDAVVFLDLLGVLLASCWA